MNFKMLEIEQWTYRHFQNLGLYLHDELWNEKV